VTQALSRRDVEGAPVSEPERTLLRFVVLVTQHAWRTTAEDVQRLRDAGWTEEQIGEAVYITALFAFFNRVADAFGLADPGYNAAAAQASQVEDGEVPGTSRDS
jgi:alkylhydroperoxidase family enzyme